MERKKKDVSLFFCSCFLAKNVRPRTEERAARQTDRGWCGVVYWC